MKRRNPCLLAGCAAFTVYITNAICAEPVCSETFPAVPRAAREPFPGGLHLSN